MKNILFLISIMFFLSSCCNEVLNDNIDDNKDYSVALDTLKNYNDYILGDFNGKSLVSTHLNMNKDLFPTDYTMYFDWT